MDRLQEDIVFYEEEADRLFMQTRVYIKLGDFAAVETTKAKRESAIKVVQSLRHYEKLTAEPVS